MLPRFRVALLALSLPPFAAHAQSATEEPAWRPVAFGQVVPVPSVPNDAWLEAHGARIGAIEVLVDDVFENGALLAAPYRLANGLHIATRADTVRAQLVFRSGDVYRRRQLDESARLLRGNAYLNAADVEPARYHDDNTVDVRVRVHDVWTLNPGFSFGRKGGENSTTFKFEDTNFLGLGKEVDVERTDDVDRSAWRVFYWDPNVLGSRWRLSAVYARLSDGQEKAFGIARPFYSLDANWAFDAHAADVLSSVWRYRAGEALERFDMQERAFDVSAGFSPGVEDGWVRRWLTGVRYDDRAFARSQQYDSASLPDDRVVSYPWVGVEWLQDAYVETHNLDQIGRSEDLYVGRSARVELGLASDAFGASSDGVILNAALRAAAQPAEDRYLIGTLAVSSRIERGALHNARLDLGARYYLRRSTRRVFFAGASASFTERLDPEEQLLLGGDSGLRGYPLRYQGGTARSLFTLEERFYTHWQPLKLFDVGAAAFMDVGRTWGRDAYAGESLGWLSDVGVGLRLGHARTGLGTVLHIDLAVPLHRSSDIDAVQFVVETRRSF